MNVSLNFPAEIESALQRRAQAAGQDVATFVQVAVAEKLAEPEEPPGPRSESHEGFRQKLRRIVDRHPRSTGHVDDSRESIYAGRGA